MALGAKEAASFILSVPKFHSLNKSVVSSSIRFNISAAASSLKLNLGFFNCTKTKPGFLQLHAAVVNLQQQEEEEEEKKEVEKWDNRRKLFVLNLPWSFSVVDIKKLFGECGVVDDVEIIKQKDGKSRGFAFVTMGTGEEAQAAILKYDSHELSDRIIRVEFAKQFKRPIRTSDHSVVSSSSIPAGETRHKLYVSNLGWKVRSTDLREFFSSKFKPISVKVVFDSPSGKSAGYGFVSFATKEEADSVISQLDGKELLGRPIRLKPSEKNIIGTSQTKQEKKEEEELSEKSIIDNSENKEEEEEEEESIETTFQSTEE
ncbi:hypothetical protein ACP275_01G117800 [Erythranthe tilingii]